MNLRGLSSMFAVGLATGLLVIASGYVRADTVTGSPASCINSADIGSEAWNNTGSARLSDNAYASAGLANNETSNYLLCTGYGFSIPAWAMVNGITVNVERRASQSGPRDRDVRLVDAGVVGTADRASSTDYTATDAVEAHGGGGDLWGVAWTAAKVNAANFGVAFAARKPWTWWGGSTVYVDAIGVTINYTVPPRSCVSVTSGNWSAPATWNCGSGPGDGPPIATDTVTINNNNHLVSLDTSASATSLTINSGTLQQTGGATRTLAISGDVTNSGTIADNGASGSLDLTVGGNLTVNGTSFAVDSLSVAGNTTASAPFIVRGAFNVGGDLTNSGALNVGSLVFTKAGTQAATFWGTGSVVGNFTVNNGSTVSSNNYSTVNLTGNLTNNGAINLPNTSWVIGGSSAQAVTGSSDSALGNLTMNNASGLALGRNVSVPGVLTLSSGMIATGSYTLSLGGYCPASVSGGSAASFVNGQLRLTYPAWAATCIYPVGTATTFAPVSVAIPWFQGIAGGTLTASTGDGEHPQVTTSLINPVVDVNRYWTLGATGDTMATLPAGGSYTATLGFVAGDVDAGANVAAFKVSRYNSGTWSSLAGSVSGTTATYPGQTAFGSFAVGQSLPPVVMLGKTASASAAAVDSYVTFNITASNPFDGDLNNVVVTDVIPAGIEYSAHVVTSGTATVSGQTLAWMIPTLQAGTTAQLTLVVKLVQKGTFTNTATSPGAASASASILVLSSSYVHYRMDAVAGSWAGAAGEVFDSGENGLHGRRRTTSTPTTTNTVVPTPTIDSQHSDVVGGFCNAGGFDSRAVVESASSEFFQFKTALSASAWIYPTAYPSSDLYSILSNDTNYEFHLNPAGKLYWWWQASTLASAATIPLNQWTHVAVTLDSTSANRRQRIYINGVQDANTNNWAGTLAANACPFYIGGDINTGSGCALSTGRNFRGMIDEVKIYDYELNAAEVEADMTLGRLCSGTFDHVRIEHDGSASSCSPKTVTLKACLDASCTALYQGDVTVKLTPSGWIGGDTVTIKNGVATATLSNASIAAPSLTLDTADIGPAPANGTRCFNGTTETCTLSVVATSCSFDAVEPGASPQTHLFTKRAGVAFNVDLLALSTSTTVNKGYKGTVAAEVVDTSSVACPNGTVLSSATATVTFAGGDQGRKTASFTIPTPTASAQVRIKAGNNPYACSYDKFAVRPSAATLSTSNANAAAPSSSAAPTVRAGGAFNIGATTAPTGYTGTLTLDSSKLQAQLPTDDATVQGGGTVGALAFSPALKANTSQGNNATYTEVGYLYATAGAFRDTSFTSVDQIGQPAGCAATDTCDCLLSSNETNSGVPNYLSDVLINGRYGCYVGNKATYSFGRFIPDHFDTATTQACVVGAFTYSGQPFPLTVTANSAAGGATANYTGKFAKSVTLSARDTGDTADNPGPGVLANAVVPAASFAAGVASATPTYTFGALQTAPTNVRIRAIEPEVSSLRTPPAVTVEGAAAVRSGRARLGSAYGSELLDLPVLFRTEFWNGTGWVLNAADSCTGDTTVNAANAVSVMLASTPAALPTCVRDTGNPGLSGANACVAVVPTRQFREGGGAAGFAGEFNLWLAAPGANNPGWTTVTATVPAWLGVVPTTRATFGSYKTPLIYRRETY